MSQSTSLAPRRAFTLLELSIVILLLVAVMAITWPRLRTHLQRSLPREAALQLTADLAGAREQAIRTGVPWAVRIQPNTGHYEVAPVRAFRGQLSNPDVTMMRETFSGSAAALTPERELKSHHHALPPVAQRRQSNTSRALGQNVVARRPRSDLPEKTSRDTPVVLPERRELPVDVVFEGDSSQQVVPLDDSPPDPARSSFMEAAETAAANEGDVSPPLDWDADGEPPAAVGRWVYAAVFQPDGRSRDRAITINALPTKMTVSVKIRGLTGGISMSDPLQAPANGESALGERREPLMEVSSPVRTRTSLERSAAGY